MGAMWEGAEGAEARSKSHDSRALDGHGQVAKGGVVGSLVPGAPHARCPHTSEEENKGPNRTWERL